MRNDARPIGHRQSTVDSPQSTVDSSQSRDSRKPDVDPRRSVTRGRQSHVVNRGAEDNARRDDADLDPTMPTGDSTVNTKI